MTIEADKPSELSTKELHGVSNTLMDRAVLILYYCFPEFRAKFSALQGERLTPQEVLRDFASFQVQFEIRSEEEGSVFMADHTNLGYKRKFMLVEQSKNGGKTMILSSRKSSGMRDDDDSGHAIYYEENESGASIKFEDNREAINKIEDRLFDLVKGSQDQHQQK